MDFKSKYRLFLKALSSYMLALLCMCSIASHSYAAEEPSVKSDDNGKEEREIANSATYLPLPPDNDSSKAVSDDNSSQTPQNPSTPNVSDDSDDDDTHRCGCASRASARVFSTVHSGKQKLLNLSKRASDAVTTSWYWSLFRSQITNGQVPQFVASCALAPVVGEKPIVNIAPPIVNTLLQNYEDAHPLTLLGIRTAVHCGTGCATGSPVTGTVLPIITDVVANRQEITTGVKQLRDIVTNPENQKRVVDTTLAFVNHPAVQLTAGAVAWPFAGPGPLCSAVIGVAPNYLSSEVKDWVEKHPKLITATHAASTLYNWSLLEALVPAQRSVRHIYSWLNSETRDADLQYAQSLIADPAVSFELTESWKKACVDYVKNDPTVILKAGSLAPSFLAYQTGLTGPQHFVGSLISTVPGLFPKQTQTALEESGIPLAAHLINTGYHHSWFQASTQLPLTVYRMFTASSAAPANRPVQIGANNQQQGGAPNQAAGNSPTILSRILPPMFTDAESVRASVNGHYTSELKNLEDKQSEEAFHLEGLLEAQLASLDPEEKDEEAKRIMAASHAKQRAAQQREHDSEKALLERKRLRAIEKLKEAIQKDKLTEFAFRQEASKVGDVVTAPLKTIPNVAKEKFKELQMSLRVKMGELAETIDVAQQNFQALLRDPTKVGTTAFLKWAKAGGTALAGWTALGLGRQFISKGIDYYWMVMSNLVQKPKLFLESSQKGYIERVTDIFTKNKSAFSEMIFSPEQEKTAGTLLERTKAICQRIARGEPVFFPGILAYGPPGTGKTMLLSKVAKESGMAFVILTGSSLAPFIKNGTAVTELMNLFFYIQFISPRPVMVYIDEGETLVRNRDSLQDDKDGRAAHEALTTLLTLTGTPSNKFMLAISTNYKDHLDPAIIDRVSEYIYIGFADTDTRRKILELYINKIMYRRMNGRPFKQKAKELFTKEYIAELAAKTEGFSNRSLHQLVTKIHSDSLVAENSIVSPEVVDRALKQMTEKTMYLQKLEKMKQLKLKQKELDAEWQIGSLSDKIAERDKQTSVTDLINAKQAKLSATQESASTTQTQTDKTDSAAISNSNTTVATETKTENTDSITQESKITTENAQEQASSSTTESTVKNATLKGRLFGMLGQFRRPAMPVSNQIISEKSPRAAAAA